MIIHRYYCIVCKYITHTAEPWVVAWYKCPSCNTAVELRALPPINDEVMLHVEQSQKPPN